jgi:hypothetical protein
VVINHNLFLTQFDLIKLKRDTNKLNIINENINTACKIFKNNL